MFWDRFKKRRVIDTEEMPAEIRGCPNCGSEQFYEGPSGGLAINIKCANPKCADRDLSVTLKEETGENPVR
jgi:hypothetical protein